MKTALGLLAFFGTLAGMIYLSAFSGCAKQEHQARLEREAADARPRVIREADGCKVYAFKNGDYWHYFTRCSDGTVTTERNWTESRRQGKQTITEHKSETIVTTQEGVR